MQTIVSDYINFLSTINRLSVKCDYLMVLHDNVTSQQDVESAIFAMRELQKEMEIHLDKARKVKSIECEEFCLSYKYLLEYLT